MQVDYHHKFAMTIARCCALTLQWHALVVKKNQCGMCRVQLLGVLLDGSVLGEKQRGGQRTRVGSYVQLRAGLHARRQRRLAPLLRRPRHRWSPPAAQPLLRHVAARTARGRATPHLLIVDLGQRGDPRVPEHITSLQPLGGIGTQQRLHKIPRLWSNPLRVEQQVSPRSHMRDRQTSRPACVQPSSQRCTSHTLGGPQPLDAWGPATSARLALRRVTIPARSAVDSVRVNIACFVPRRSVMARPPVRSLKSTTPSAYMSARQVGCG